MSAEEPSVLVIPPTWLGDAVLALPTIRALEALGPVSILAHPRVAPLYAWIGGFERVEAYAGPAVSAAGFRQARAIGAFVRRAAPRSGARAVVFPRSFSSALRARASGLGERVGLGAEGRAILLTHRVRVPWPARSRHVAEEFALLATAAGAPPHAGPPRIEIDPDLLARGEAMLRRAGGNGAGPRVALAPGAAFGPAKRWAADRFAEIARRVVSRGGSVVLIGSASDREVTALVARGAESGGALLDLAGETDLAMLAAILASVRVAVVNDSGPMHLAAAVGTPVVALFGSTSASWTAPLGAGHAVFQYPVPCSPCFRRTCPIGAVCFEGIATDAVWEAVARRIA